MNITPPISVALHAALHKDLYEHFGNTEDLIAYRMLSGLSLKGIEFTPEYRSKISTSRIGIIFSKTHRENIRKALLGRVCSEETKNKHRLASFGNKWSLGHTHFKETKEKMSLAKKGKPNHPQSKETREKLRLFNLGKKLSQETRMKMCISQQKRRAYCSL